MRLRILVIMIGAFLVVAAFSFPYWQRFVQDTPEEIMILFPGLPVNQQSDFASLPLDQLQVCRWINNRLISNCLLVIPLRRYGWSPRR